MRIDEVTWEDVTGSRTKLLATIHILGCPMHLEAYEVEEDEDIGQRAKDFSFEADLDSIAAGVTTDGPWTQVCIEGRNYVLVAAPYCD